jgi:XisH protein
MAKDLYHQQVKAALIKDGWVITHDPYYLDIDNQSPMEIDLGAEKLICAERGAEQILVEVKSFLNRSLTYDFHAAYGQFRIYRRGIMKTDPNRILFLAIPEDVYIEIQMRPFYVDLIAEENIKILVFNPLTQIITRWIH